MKRTLYIILSLLLVVMPTFAAPPMFTPDTTNLAGVETMQFDTTAGGSTHSEGKLEWNATAGTLDLHTDVTNTVIQVGQEMLIKVVNKTGSTIDNGEVVYISGAQGNRPTVTLAQADAEVTADRTLGLATEDIDNNQEGYITTNGLVRDVDTSSFTIGDMLYLSAVTPGAIVNTAPVSPDHEVVLGFCVVSNANNGVILVTINNGHELDDAHDTLINSVANNDMLAWNSTSSLWENTADIVVNSIGPYGELWWHDDDGTGSGTDISIATTPVFVNIASANISTGAILNTTVTAADGSITVDLGGIYSTQATYSVTTSTGAAEVDFKLGVNGTVQDNCSAHRSIGAGGGNDLGNVGITCLLDLSAGDAITGLINSVASETVQFEAFNLNVTK
jgi:hypothetical protein